MEKREECVSVQDVEEGEISDSASVEEISEEDFSKPETRVSITDPKKSVWTMRDLYKYPNKYQISSNYASGLYNLAWAQAVQNKPLDEFLVMGFKNTENSELKRTASSNSVNNRSDSKNSDGGSGNSLVKEVNNKVVIDVCGDEAIEEFGGGEKEEGELEEGEIDLDLDLDLDLEVIERVMDGDLKNELDANKSDIDVEDNELEKRVKLIREELETVTVNDAEKSYDGVCFRLQNSLDSLLKVVLENNVPKKDDLVQLSLSAIRTVYSVFCSMSQNQKERNRDMLSRLLTHVTSQMPPLFSPEQMKEIEVMMPSMDSHDVSLSTKDSDKDKEIQVTERVNQNDSDDSAQNDNQDFTSFQKFSLDSMPIETSDQNEPHTLLDYLKMGVASSNLESSKIGVASSKGRGTLLPLLDLHMDHDADSLPSPTREILPCLPVDKALAVEDAVVRTELPAATRGAFETENAIMHLYETDALKAVSTYQQKFGRSSFLMDNRLPSPTPSEDGDVGDTDTGGEVSSTSIIPDVSPVNAPAFTSPIVSSVAHMDICGGQGLINVRNAGLVSSGSNNVLRASVKSRDPRLRFANSDSSALDLNQCPFTVVNNEPKLEPLGGIISSRKQKIVEEPVLDFPVLKRQRTELTDSVGFGGVQAVSGTGGWLEDRGTVGLQVTNRNHVVDNRGSDPRKVENAVICSDTNSSIPNVTINENENLPVTGANTLHSLLKDIAVNPTMWMNIIKMEQQKSDPAKSSSQPARSNSLLGALPTISVASKPSMLGQAAGILQTPQTASMDELGKIRMKPRDPRRVLHSNSFQKSGSLGSDLSKTITGSAQGNTNLNSQKLEDQSDKKPMSSQSVMAPDIAHQFTKNLKNIADIMSVSQATTTPPTVPQIPSSQPVQVHPSWVDLKVLPESGHLQSGAGSASEEVAACPARSQNTWADVEHLFEGFDDQQKAAIQRERARRIEEQTKMFAARKLCLVLDLDHTLLNSAKFLEIDPMHDELLRKKEEQDREKPQRHLFRFPHMGMWTKLRPGIWNFLEKASKLYELHLYTMGNKLYATEMAKVLDPKGVLFAGRVLSKGDDGDLIDGGERVPKSKDLEGVLGMESAVVIIDDSVRVWPHNKLNLMVVERYIYFPCSRRQFGLPGPSLLEIDHDERPEDGTLASSLAVIETIHQNFFSHRSLDEADVRNILASEQRKVLTDCRIVFSRVFPVGEANPQLHPLWQTAEQFGAVCTTQIDEQVTHVVANSLGTDKVNWALSTGRFVVHPAWVEASALLYRRANEHDFAIKS